MPSAVVSKIRSTLGIAMVLTLTQVAFSAPSFAASNAPTRADVEKVLKSIWDKAPSSMNPKTVLTLNAVKFGNPARATLQEVQVEGIPQNATVTPAIVDFTVREYNPKETLTVRRVREARVYVDKMNEWAVMTGSPKGQDVTTREPAAK
jgi:hypothetical protein